MQTDRRRYSRSIGMPNYRAYVIGSDGSFARAHNFSAADDKDARTHAERYVDGHDVELWRDDTKLALLLREDVVKRKRG